MTLKHIDTLAEDQPCVKEMILCRSITFHQCEIDRRFCNKIRAPGRMPRELQDQRFRSEL